MSKRETAAGSGAVRQRRRPASGEAQAKRQAWGRQWGAISSTFGRRVRAES